MLLLLFKQTLLEKKMIDAPVRYVAKNMQPNSTRERAGGCTMDYTQNTFALLSFEGH